MSDTIPKPDGYSYKGKCCGTCNHSTYDREFDDDGWFCILGIPPKRVIGWGGEMKLTDPDEMTVFELKRSAPEIDASGICPKYKRA